MAINHSSNEHVGNNVSPEEQLIHILNAVHSAQSDGSEVAAAARRSLVEWCENHLRQNMKAIMFRAFGPQIAKEGSLRFTALWNDVLLKVLKSGRVLAKEEDVTVGLKSYFSTALANQARTYIKRRKRLGKILDDEIKPLVELRERHLQESYQINFEFLLEKAQQWENAGDICGQILRLRYLDGMQYEEIADMLAISRDRVKHALAEGKERLRRLASEVKG
jgi:RNA polymerase sigma factor (sigma-70 family)